MSLSELEHYLGVKLSGAVAGVVGAIVSLTLHEKLTLVKALGLIITGGAVSAYSTYATQAFLHLPPELGGFIGFILGLCSLKLVEKVSSAFPQ